MFPLGSIVPLLLSLSPNSQRPHMLDVTVNSSTTVLSTSTFFEGIRT
jgi:hypothetical protein